MMNSQGKENKKKN